MNKGERDSGEDILFETPSHYTRETAPAPRMDSISFMS